LNENAFRFRSSTIELVTTKPDIVKKTSTADEATLKRSETGVAQHDGNNS